MVGFIVAAIAGLLVFVVTLRALDHVDFGRVSRWTLALCVAILSVLGISGLVTVPAGETVEGSETGGYTFLLLPYAALGLTLLVGLLLMFLLEFIREFRRGMERARHGRSPQPVDRGNIQQRQDNHTDENNNHQ